MLQSIRDKSQGWLSTAIIGLICITFAFWGIHSYISGGNGAPDIVAKINGQAIHQADLNTAYQRLRMQQQMQLGAAFTIDQKIEQQLKQQALNQLVMTRVLSHAAAKEGYRVTADEVGSALLSIPMFQVDGRFSRERFNEILNNILYTENGFLTELQTAMLINQVRAGFVNSAFSLPQDIATAIRLVNQKRDFSYLILPANHFSKDVNISEDQALAYYKQHQAQFVAPELMSAEYIELSLPQIAARLHFSDAQLMQFYNNNLNSYTVPERWQVAHILVKLPQAASVEQIAAAQNKINAIANRLKSGESFAQLAQTESDDTTSAKNGGVLDWITPGMSDPSFEKAVSALKQVGDTSLPIRTKYGFSIIKLIGFTKPQVQPFAKVREQVEKAIAQQQADQVFADSSEKLSNLTFANPASLGVAAKTLDLAIQNTDLFSRRGGKDHITANPKIIDAAFSSDVLHGNNSAVITLDPDTLVVLRLKQHIPAHMQTFAQVRDEVTKLLTTQAEQKQAMQAGQQVLQQLQAGKNKDELVQQLGLSWQVATNAARFDSKVPGVILNTAFRLPRPTTAAASNNGFSLPSGDYAVISVSAVRDGEPGKNSIVQQRAYREELENSFGQLDYSLYVRGILSKAKVDIKSIKPTENPDEA